MKKPPPTIEQFVDSITTAIDASELTITEIARRAKITRPYVYRIKSGKQVPTIAVARRLATVLGLRIDIRKISDAITLKE